MRRREAREERSLLGRIGQFRVGHLLHLAAQQHRVGRHAHVLTTFRLIRSLSPVRIFTATPGRCSALMRSRGRLLRRIQKRHVALEHQIALVVFGADLLPRQFLLATASTRNPSSLSFSYSFFSRSIRSAPLATVCRPVRNESTVKDRFRRAFGEQDRLAFGILHHHGHHAPREIEGDLVELLVFFGQRLLMKIGTFENGAGRADSSAPSESG